MRKQKSRAKPGALPRAEAARLAKATRALSEIPADTTDIALAIKRHVWTTDRTLTQLAGGLGMNLHYLERVLGAQTRKQTQRLHPSLLNRICEVLNIDLETRARWHILGARSHGWEIPLNRDDERDERFAALPRVGCLCCLLNERLGFARVPIPRVAYQLDHQRIEIHHLNEGGKPGGKRRGDRFTIPLCSWHHRGVRPVEVETSLLATAMYGPSWARGTRPFRLSYGTDDELLAMADSLLVCRDPNDRMEDAF